MSVAYRVYALVNWVIIASGNGLSPFRHQAITWTNADSLSIGPLGTNSSEIRIKIPKLFIHENAFEIVVCEMSAIFSRGRKLMYQNNLVPSPRNDTQWFLKLIHRRLNIICLLKKTTFVILVERWSLLGSLSENSWPLSCNYCWPRWSRERPCWSHDDHVTQSRRQHERFTRINTDTRSRRKIYTGQLRKVIID